MCLLKHLIEGRIEWKGRRGKRRRQLLNELKETRRYRKFKQGALVHILWRTGFRRGYGSVVNQTT